MLMDLKGKVLRLGFGLYMDVFGVWLSPFDFADETFLVNIGIKVRRGSAAHNKSPQYHRE